MSTKNNRFKWDGKLVQFLELLLDVIVVVGVYLLSVIILAKVPVDEIFKPGQGRTDLMIMSSVLAVGVVLVFRIYQVTITKKSYFNTMFRLTISLIIIFFLAFFTSLINVSKVLPRTSLFLMLIIQVSIFAVVKGIAYFILKRVNIKTTLIIGPRAEVHALAKKILFDDNKYVELKYLVYEDEKKLDYNKIFEYIDNIDNVYITENLHSKHKNTIISYCFKANKAFFLVPKLYELSINAATVGQAGDTLLYEIKSFGLSLEQRFFKRAFDLIVSITMLIITFPIMLIFAIAIKVYDRGPIFFKQERITRNNDKFILYKFRTMIPNAEEDTGPVLATSKDERITKIGKIMRATRIDELPQLINIIKGEMSIVGPRPEREFFIKQFLERNNDYQYRLEVKAGVTGLAQAQGTYNTEFDEKLRFDIYYITNYSMLRDINILFQTVRSIFDPSSSKGVSEEDTLVNILEHKNYHIFDTDRSYIEVVVKK